MKRPITHILTAAAALLAVLGCTKNEPNTNGRLITMTAHEAGATKALLDADSFMTAGNQIVVYDYYTQGSQTTTTETGYYINGAIAQSTGSTTAGVAWPFVGQSYSWTEDGKHKFFGWLNKDNGGNTAESFFARALTLTNDKLQLPAKTLDQRTSQQFDFMYSDINVRDLDVDEPDFVSSVGLSFSHLFTAFSISAQNMSTVNAIKLRKVQIEGMNSMHTATIDYSGNSVKVDYGSGSNSNGNQNPDYTFDFGEGITLSTTAVDLATKTAEKQYYLAWPMTSAQAKATKITLTYRSNESQQDETKIIYVANPWEAGKMNNVTISFIDKFVDLTWEVVDWSYEPEIMDFTDVVTITNEGKLHWEDYTSFNENTGEIIINNTAPLQGTFRIDAPVGAIWTASLIGTGEGQVDAFEWVGDNYGMVGEDATIMIRAANNAPFAPTHKVLLRIAVRTGDGRTIVVNDLTPAGKHYHEFTIVQNMI